MNQFIPDKFDGWEVVEPDHIYSTQNLYDLIDGGAELYLAYQFRQMLQRRFTNRDSIPIEVNLFDMGTANNAFGIFHHDLEDEAVGIGQESEYGYGWLRFWQGRYFVYIFADDETPSIRQAILELGRIIAQNIPSSPVDIRLLKILPEQGKIDGSLRYFYHPTILNYHYYLANYNILHLSPNSEAIFIKYCRDENKASLLLVQYPTAEYAMQVYNSFIDSYFPESINQQIVLMEDGTYHGAERKDDILILVLAATSAEFASELINNVRINIKENSDEKK